MAFNLNQSITREAAFPLDSREIFKTITLANNAKPGLYAGQKISIVPDNGIICHYTVDNDASKTLKPLINAASCGVITVDEGNKKINFNIGDTEKISFSNSGGGVFQISSENISSIYSTIDIAVPNGSGEQYSIGSTLKSIRNIEIKGENGLTGSGTLEDNTIKLSVVAGNGISVNNNGVSVKVKTNGGITVNGDGVQHYTPTTVATNKTTGGRTYINSISFDSFGHVTAIDTGTETSEAVDGSKLTFSKNLEFTESFGKYSTTYNSGAAETDGLFGGTSNGKYTLKTYNKDLETLLLSAFSQKIEASVSLSISYSPTTSILYGNDVTITAVPSFNPGTTGISEPTWTYTNTDSESSNKKTLSPVTSSKRETITVTGRITVDGETKDITASADYAIYVYRNYFYMFSTSKITAAPSNTTGYTSFPETTSKNIKTSSNKIKTIAILAPDNKKITGFNNKSYETVTFTKIGKVSSTVYGQNYYLYVYYIDAGTTEASDYTLSIS